MKAVYLVLVSKKGGYEVHSIHASEPVARCWMECKSHDGEDCTIGTVDVEILNEFVAKDDPSRA